MRSLKVSVVEVCEDPMRTAFWIGVVVSISAAALCAVQVILPGGGASRRPGEDYGVVLELSGRSVSAEGTVKRGTSPRISRFRPI